MPIQIQKITAAPEEIMAQVQELYQMSFPPHELRSFDRIREELVAPNGERRTHLITALDGDRVLGLSIFAVFPKASLSYLWYLCVDPDTRGLGLGGKLYQESVKWMNRDADTLGIELRGMIFEVERLTSESHPVYGDPFRRVRFYERLGARMVQGYDYYQPPIPPHGPVPLQLMFHPIGLGHDGCESPALACIVSDFLRLAQGIVEPLDGCELRLMSLTDVMDSSTTP